MAYREKKMRRKSSLKVLYVKIFEISNQMLKKKSPTVINRMRGNDKDGYVLWCNDVP